MDLFLIIAIIFLGLLFMFVEIFLIPGTSILTLLGFVIIGVGVYLGYKDYGNTVGTWLLSGSIIGMGITLYIGYKRIQSKKWALYSNIDGKVNVEDFSKYKVGDIGKTFSALRPEGKAVFLNDERITVYSTGNFIDKDTEVEIIKIDKYKIYVKKI
ncbi:MAG: NfeD family protein [Chitinophagales bacterium]